MGNSSKLALRTALFLSGASVMVIEILGARIIGPHFGAGLYVWTSLITVALIALAFGYWVGGTLADRHPSCAALAVVLVLAAAAVAVIPPVRLPVINWAWGFGLRGGSLVASAVLFFPSLFLLGMVSPFAVRLETASVASVGRSAGHLYAISTAGSVLGALLTGFYLIPTFRIPTVTMIVAVTLVAAALLVSLPKISRRLAVMAILCAGGSLALLRGSPQPGELVEQRNSAGADLRVVDFEKVRVLLIDQVPQSTINKDGRAVEQYIYFIAARLIMARPHARDAAVIGLGGGGIVPLLEQEGMRVEGVDLSPDVIDLAKTRLGLKLPAAQLHAVDGRVYLHENPGRFDAVVLDVFNGDRAAFSVLTKEGLQAAKASLKAGGILALNTWGIDLEKGGPDKLGAALRNTLQEVFPHVLAIPAVGNLLLFGSDEPITPQRGSVILQTFDGPLTFAWLGIPPTTWPEAPVLTDDWNPADMIDARAVEDLRASRRTSLPATLRQALAWE